jgi:hypothetical protein
MRRNKGRGQERRKRGLHVHRLPKREQDWFASSPKEAATSPVLLSQYTERMVEFFPFKKPGSAIPHSPLSNCFLYLCESFPYISHVASLVLYNNSSEKFQS